MSPPLKHRMEKLEAFKKMLETAKGFKSIDDDTARRVMSDSLIALRHEPARMHEFPSQFKSEMASLAMLGLSLSVNVINGDFDIVVRSKEGEA